MLSLKHILKVMIQDIEQVLLRQRPKFYLDILTKEHRQTLVSLRSLDDVIMKKADKGSATGLISRENHIVEVMRESSLQQRVH